LERKKIKNIIESLIFVSEKPLSIDKIKYILGIKRDEIAIIIDELMNEYKDRGIQIFEVGGGYQFRTRAQYSDWILKLNKNKPIKFSKPTLETLAVIAYKQPITRREIEKIRGVDVSGILRNLMKIKLIKMTGKKNVPGKPVTYGVTKEFLELFSLNSLKDLPNISEFSDL
jgi:segregation and condensation protein B